MSLHKHFETVKKILKTIPTVTKGGGGDLPWYLVVGMSGAGKSTLLAQSGLEFVMTEELIEQKPDGMATAGEPNWWVTRSAVFIDVPGYYLYTAHWKELLGLIKKIKPISGVIVTLSLADLALQAKHDREESLQKFKQCVQDIGEQFSVYVLFNKVDTITGFNQFFHELSQEERTQPWGITFSTPGVANPPQLLKCFSAEYDRLLARLNERLILVLHQEQELENRTLIKDFPLQIENLKPLMAGFVYILSEIVRHSPRVMIRGIYLCSSLQDGTESINCVLPTLRNYFEIDSEGLNDLGEAVFKKQAYFVEQLFRSIILSEAEAVPMLVSPVTRAAREKQYITYAAAGLVLLSATVYGCKGYNHQVQRIELARQAVAEYKQLTQRLPQSQSDLVAMLPLFDTLYRAQRQLSDVKLPWLFSQVSNKHDQVMTAVPQLYQQALQMQFIPGLKNLLEEQLSSQRVMDPRYAYPTLKTYLMLGKPEQLNKLYFKAWFMRHFKGQPKVQKQLQKYLDIMLEQPLVPIQLNPLLVSQTQQVLSMVPEPMLAYVVLQDQVSTQLPEYQSILDVQDSRAVFADQMPSLYTKTGFDLVYNKMIPAVVKQIVETDQVLGEKRFSAGRKPDALIQGVRDLYLIDYSKIWDKFIARLKLQPVLDLQQLDQVLQAAPVAFTKLEQAIIQNTTLDIKNPPPEAPNINDQFSALKTTPLKPAIKQLQALQTVIVPVLKSDNVSQAALAALPKISGLSQQIAILPEPFKSWTHQLVTQSNMLLLQEARNYLNASWKKEVVVFYNERIAHRYPLVKAASKEISPADFAEFFGQKGRLNTYFENHLKSFVDTSTPRWQWRSNPLKMPDELLLQFQRAAMMRKMYFDANQKLDVKIQVQPGNLTLKWPAKTAQLGTLSVSGPWALFKLLDQGQLQHLSGPHHFEWRTMIDGQPMRYELLATQTINPLIAGIVDEFRLPERL